MFQRLGLGVCFLLFAVLPLLGDQALVTAFDNVKYGRAAGPVTSFGSYVSVEPTLGAVNIRVPLGPGIGVQGARYQPVFEHRISPNTLNFRFNLGYALRPILYLGVQHARLRLPNGDEVSTPNELALKYPQDESHQIFDGTFQVSGTPER